MQDFIYYFETVRTLLNIQNDDAFDNGFELFQRH